MPFRCLFSSPKDPFDAPKASTQVAEHEHVDIGKSKTTAPAMMVPILQKEEVSYAAEHSQSLQEPCSPSFKDTIQSAESNIQADWLIEQDQIEMGGRIGAGSYGEVYRGKWRGVDVAVKTTFLPMSDGQGREGIDGIESRV